MGRHKAVKQQGDQRLETRVCHSRKPPLPPPKKSVRFTTTCKLNYIPIHVLANSKNKKKFRHKDVLHIIAYAALKKLETTCVQKRGIR